MQPRASCTRSCSGWGTLMSAGQQRKHTSCKHVAMATAVHMGEASLPVCCWCHYLLDTARATWRHMQWPCSSSDGCNPTRSACTRYTTLRNKASPMNCAACTCLSCLQVCAVAVACAGLLPHQARHPQRHQAREPAGGFQPQCGTVKAAACTLLTGEVSKVAAVGCAVLGCLLCICLGKHPSFSAARNVTFC